MSDLTSSEKISAAAERAADAGKTAAKNQANQHQQRASCGQSAGHGGIGIPAEPALGAAAPNF